MDFRFTDDQLQFRADLQDFVATEWSSSQDDWYGEGDEQWEASVSFRRKLAEHGWLTMAWPKEYGGRGATYMEQAIYAETMTLAGAPGPDMGIDRVAPTLMLFANEDQK